MKPFPIEERPTQTSAGSERFVGFVQSLRDALIPRAGPASSVQGELLRANDRLTSELLRNGFANYYVEGEALETNYYGELLLFMLGTLIDNKNGASTDEEVASFQAARHNLAADHASAILESKAEEAHPPLIGWDDLLIRALGCIANWCIANPKLVDRRGRAVEANGLSHLKQLGKAKEAPPPCPTCKGRGFVPQVNETAFPELCECKGGRARPS